MVLGISCSQDVRLDNVNGPAVIPAVTPIQAVERPSDWKQFEMGQFTVSGPKDMKIKKWQGDDSNGYTLENKEFLFDVDISMYNAGENQIHSFQYTTGTIIIDGKFLKYTKTDLNKPAANAAVNADGSKAKPIEKNIMIEVRFPEEEAIVSVNYSNESSIQSAMAMLQSITLNSKK